MTTETGRPSVRAAAPWLLGALLILAALLMVAMAARGQDAGTGIATTGDGEQAAPANTNRAPADQEAAGLLYAQCMRDNGVPDFPDPDADGQISLSAGHGAGEHDADDPTFVAAQEACSDLLPEGADHQDLEDPEYVEQMREFAQCMRDNGVPDFPDPGPDGQLLIDHESGIDRNDPKLQAAMETCYEAVPGVAH